MRRYKLAEAWDLTPEIEEEQCFRRLLQRAAQCSVASSNKRLGYFETSDLWRANRCWRSWVDWVVFKAWSITLRTEANRAWECSVEDTTCSTTDRVSKTIMLTSVARLPSMWDSSSGSQTEKMKLWHLQGKNFFHIIPKTCPLCSKVSGIFLEFWTDENDVLFHRLPWPSMLGDGGAP